MSDGAGRRLSVLALVAVTLAGCRERVQEHPPPLRVVRRLVADRYQAPGDPSMDAVPTAMVGDERRPVLAQAMPTTLHQGAIACGGRRISLDLPVPDALRGRTLRLAVQAYGRAVAAMDVKPVTVHRAGARQRVRFTCVGGAPGGKPLVRVTARAAPDDDELSAPFVVPPGAHLRFAVGIDESEWPPGLPPVGFRLSVLADDGERTVFETARDPAARPEERAWAEHDVDLGRYAGRTVRLRFDTRAAVRPPRAPIVYPMWADPTVVAPGATEPRERNVLLVSLDTLRGDHLGFAGYPRPTSPVIDTELAARGVAFLRAYSQFPGTEGSHMSLLTSLYPCVQRQGEPGATFAGAPRADAHLLSELLRAAGYATAAFTEDGWVTAANGFARGFGTFVEATSPIVDQPDGQADATFRRGLAWIRGHADAPWFVFLHTYQVHHPYTPPPGYVEKVVTGRKATDEDPDVALYDGEIRYTDELLGELLAALEPVAGKTLVLLVSDHGDQFGEHGLHRHGNSLYDDLLHVALVMRAPGLLPAGRRIADEVGLVDVVPTVLALLGMPPPRWTHGRNLVPAFTAQPLPASPLYALLPLRNEIAVRKPPYKWIISERTGEFRVFDLGEDPLELHDVSGKVDPRTAAELLAGYRATCTTPPPPSRGDVVDPAVLEKLRALGYVD